MADVNMRIANYRIGEEVQIDLPSYPWPDGVTFRQVTI